MKFPLRRWASFQAGGWYHVWYHTAKIPNSSKKKIQATDIRGPYKYISGAKSVKIEQVTLGKQVLYAFYHFFHTGKKKNPQTQHKPIRVSNNY